jgi:hypothetical protein
MSANAPTTTARLYAVTTQEMPGIVVWSSTKSSGRARTTIEESANATAIETASAISRARRGFSLAASESMLAAYSQTALQQTLQWCWVARAPTGERGFTVAKSRIILALIGALLVALAASVVTGAARSGPDGVVVEGLTDPRGIAVAGGRALLVAEGDGEVTKVKLRRHGGAKVSTFAEFPFDPDRGPFPVEVAYQGPNHVWVTLAGDPDPSIGGGSVVRLNRKGKVTVSVDIAGYQVTDPDPDDQDDFPEESNPFGLAPLTGGGTLLTDAANNDLLKIKKNKKIVTVARFLREEVPWPEGLGDDPPPGTPTPAESVPTAVAIGPDGAWYVSELKGFPFVKGTSRIWRIEPGTKNATCDPLHPDTGPCTTFATGFTSVIDLAFGRDGTMYVLEIAKEGLLAVEVFGAPPIGALWAVKGGTKTELAPGTLQAPGGVAVRHNGTLFVTTGTFFGPDAGGVVRINP